MTLSLTPEMFAAWLDRYKAAWEQRDPQRAAGIFTADASYRETPFSAPLAGRSGIEDYWRQAVAGQADVHFSYEVLACAGDRGTCHWRAEFQSVPAGDGVILDGVFCCDFDAPDQVRKLEEWWHVQVSPAGSA